MNIKYFDQGLVTTSKSIPPKMFINVSKGCVAACLVGGAGVVTVLMGWALGVPLEGTHSLVLGAVSLAVGLAAGFWFLRRTV